MKANTPAERLVNGIIKENPTFVLVLGMCPTLAVTTSAINGIGMGLTTTVVLAMSNLMISLLRNSSRTAYVCCIYRSRSILRYHRTDAFTRIYTKPVFRTWYLHSSDRSKLYHPWSCRSICFQKSTNPVSL